MRVIKNIFRDFYMYLLWGVATWVLVGFIFSRITNTTPDKKITICLGEKCDSRELAAKLEEKLPDGIKMIKVNNFDYYLVDNGEIKTVDFFIIRESDIKQYVGGAVSLEKLKERYSDFEYYIYEDIPVGIKVHSKGESGGIAAEYIKYADENYYLLFNGGSLHSSLLNDSGDDKAFEVMENLFTIK